MKRSLMAALAALAGLAGTMASADELLDAVLDWDAPVMRSAPAAPPAAAPAAAPAAKPTPAFPAAKPAPAFELPGNLLPSAPEVEPPAPEIAVPEIDVPGGETIRKMAEQSPDLEISWPRRWSWRSGDTADDEEEDDDGDESAAGMERLSRLSLRGGGGGGKAIVAGAEWIRPLGESAFDLSLRGFYSKRAYQVEKSYKERHYYYSYSYWSGWTEHSYTTTHYYTVEEHIQNKGLEAMTVWRPFRGEAFSPYVGAGVRYESSENDDDEGGSLAWRAGTTLNLGRFALGAVYTAGQAGGDFSASLGLRCGRHFVLNAFGEYFKSKNASGIKHDGTAFGGGLTWVF